MGYHFCSVPIAAHILGDGKTMNMIFSEQEILSMIEFALRNSGSQILIAEEVTVTAVQFRDNNEVYVTLNSPDGLTEEPSSKEHSPSASPPLLGDLAITACSCCGELFKPASKRHRYCNSDACNKERARIAQARTLAKKKQHIPPTVVL